MKACNLVDKSAATPIPGAARSRHHRVCTAKLGKLALTLSAM
jgi:hypothetical protein